MKLIFIRTPSIPGGLVRGLGGTEWDHVGIIVGDRVVEATFEDGVRSRTLASLLKDRPDHRIVEFKSPDSAAGDAFALSQVGKDYDFGGLWGCMFQRDWQDSSKWYCSELAAMAMLRAGHSLFHEGPPSLAYLIKVAEALSS